MDVYKIWSVSCSLVLGLSPSIVSYMVLTRSHKKYIFDLWFCTWIIKIKIRLKIAPGGNSRNISFLSLKPWNTAWIFIVISYYILYIIWVGHKVPMKISLTLRIDKATSHLDSLIFFKKAKFFFRFIFFILGTKYKKRFYIKYVLCAKSYIFYYYFF